MNIVNIVLSKRSKSKDYVLYNSIYVKFAFVFESGYIALEVGVGTSRENGNVPELDCGAGAQLYRLTKAIELHNQVCIFYSM